MAVLSEIKTTFIQKALTEYLQTVQTLMKREMARQGVNITGDAAASITYHAIQAGGGALGELTFKEYLRFVDMGVGRSHPLGTLRATTVALRTGEKATSLVKSKIRKPKKVYAKIAYGKLGSLMGDLSFGFTEEIIKQIKSELENANTNT